MSAHTSVAMPYTAQCSWCGQHIAKGTKVIFEGRMVYHLERCAPAEYREESAK